MTTISQSNLERKKKKKSISECFNFNSNLSIRACVGRSITYILCQESSPKGCMWFENKENKFQRGNKPPLLLAHSWFDSSLGFSESFESLCMVLSSMIAGCEHFGWRYPCQRIQRCLLLCCGSSGSLLGLSSSVTKDTTSYMKTDVF